jgi:DNA-binding protein HU-beta
MKISPGCEVRADCFIATCCHNQLKQRILGEFFVPLHYISKQIINSKYVDYNMTKAELVAEISKTTGVERNAALTVVEKFMEVVKDSLAHGENVYLRGFGTFAVKERAEKTARNISKNTTVIIPAHKIPSFKPANEFKDSLK